jgi:hypothetical protein
MQVKTDAIFLQAMEGSLDTTGYVENRLELYILLVSF